MFYEGGYKQDYSMSNRAAAAYENGLRPASRISGVPAALVKRFCRAAEWHHTSARYNKTCFYDPAEVAAVFGLPGADPEAADLNIEAVAALAEWKRARRHRLADPTDSIRQCRVEWIEWGGSIKRPVPNHRVARSAPVDFRGERRVIYVDGANFCKMAGATGLKIQPLDAPVDWTQVVSDARPAIERALQVQRAKAARQASREMAERAAAAWNARSPEQVQADNEAAAAAAAQAEARAAAAAAAAARDPDEAAAARSDWARGQMVLSGSKWLPRNERRDARQQFNRDYEGCVRRGVTPVLSDADRELIQRRLDAAAAAESRIAVENSHMSYKRRLNALRAAAASDGTP